MTGFPLSRMAPVVALQVEGLHVDRAGQPIVRDVDLSVSYGEITVLLGANGAGKSTLLDGIGGVISAAAGRIVLDGVDITRRSRRGRVRQGLAYVQQGRTAFLSLTVDENLSVVARRQDFDLALGAFPELAQRMSTHAGLLSGGEQQMLVLARALLQRPRVLIVDELSLGLAPTVVDRMFAGVQQMATEGIGLLLVEQFADRALDIGHHAVVLARGSVALRGSAAEVRSQPERLRAAYLGELADHPGAKGSES